MRSWRVIYGKYTKKKWYLEPFCFCEVVCGLGCLSGTHRGDKTFVDLGLQGEPDGSSVRIIFEG